MQFELRLAARVMIQKVCVERHSVKHEFDPPLTLAGRATDPAVTSACLGPGPQSARSATSGSTSVARLAGTKQAINPTATSTAATPPKIAGSRG